MALRGTLHHRKTLRLARRLGLPQACALGVMEALWHVAGTHAPNGAIGRLTNQDIADEMLWEGDADELVQILIDVQVLDTDAAHRLLVHGWEEHADQTVKKRLAREERGFAQPSSPAGYPCPSAGYPCPSTAGTEAIHEQPRMRASPVPVPVPVPVPEPDTVPEPENPRHGEADAPPDGISPPELAASVPEPEPAKPPRRSCGPPAVELERLWGHFADAYPKREGDLKKPRGREIFVRLLGSGLDPSLLLEGAERYHAWADATGKTGTVYVQQMPTWLNGKAWENDWRVLAAPPPNGHRTPTPQEMSERTMAELRAQGAFVPATSIEGTL